MKSELCILTISMLVWLPVTGFAQCNDVVFWNKLESEENIENSEIGPGLQLTSYIYSDWEEAEIAPALFGNGLFINHDTNEGLSNDGANFFALNVHDIGLTPER
ncbi:MAG: hypothetical protein GY953_46000, partial [bacterium]|nr:hypothetical protein [bacterium]